MPSRTVSVPVPCLDLARSNARFAGGHSRTPDRSAAHDAWRGIHRGEIAYKHGMEWTPGVVQR
eukprot:10634310-Lingulodinium_polyedra.AAC.1